MPRERKPIAPARNTKKVIHLALFTCAREYVGACACAPVCPPNPHPVTQPVVFSTQHQPNDDEDERRKRDK